MATRHPSPIAQATRSTRASTSRAGSLSGQQSSRGSSSDLSEVPDYDIVQGGYKCLMLIAGMICNVFIENVEGMEQHVRWHKGQDINPLICTCGFTCTHRETFSRHRKANGEGHGKAAMANSAKPADKGYIKLADGSYQCSTCKTTNLVEKNIRKHVQRHRTQINKPSICAACGKTFQRSDALNKHLKTHEDNATATTSTEDTRPYLCERCGSQFRSPDDLARHVKRIHESKSIACTFSGCGKVIASGRKDQLQRHVKMVHNKTAKNTATHTWTKRQSPVTAALQDGLGQRNANSAQPRNQSVALSQSEPSSFGGAGRTAGSSGFTSGFQARALADSSTGSSSRPRPRSARFRAAAIPTAPPSLSTARARENSSQTKAELITSSRTTRASTSTRTTTQLTSALVTSDVDARRRAQRALKGFQKHARGVTSASEKILRAYELGKESSERHAPLRRAK